MKFKQLKDLPWSPKGTVWEEFVEDRFKCLSPYKKYIKRLAEEYRRYLFHA